MPYGLYISAEGAHAQNTRLEVIANNLANVDTVGFKRELAVLQARSAEAIRRGLPSRGLGGIDEVGGGTMVRQTKTDFSPGPLKPTGIPTDMAVRGEGFFTVQKGNETLLTRAGNFRLNSRGELVTQQGYSVLSDSGSPIVVNPNDRSLQMTDGGAIRQRDSTQNLALVRPRSLGDLVKVGENLFRTLAGTQPVPTTERSVASGYVEMSSVRPTTEMTDMIQAARILEANVNMMKAQDEMLGGLINRVLKV